MPTCIVNITRSRHNACIQAPVCSSHSSSCVARVRWKWTIMISWSWDVALVARMETGQHAALLLSCITATHSAQRSHASSRDERHRFALSVLQSQRRFMYTWSPWQPGVLKSNTHLHATYHVFLACNSIRKMCSCEKKCLVLDKSCAVVNLKHWNAIYTHSCEFTTEDHAFNQWFYAEMRVLFTLIAHRQVNQDSLNLCAKIGNINLA